MLLKESKKVSQKGCISQIEDSNIKNENLENKVLIEKVLNCCTEQERTVIKYLFFDGYTGEQVAQKLKISRQWVHTIKHRAFEKIRNHIL